MTITLDIPEQLGGGSPEELSRYVLESVVLEAYREERLGAPQADITSELLAAQPVN